MKSIKIKRIIFFVAIIVLLIFLHFSKIFSPVENKIYTILNNLSIKFYSLNISVRNIYDRQIEKKDLIDANKKLSKKVQKLLVENSRLKKLGEENSKLRQHLRFFDKNDKKYVLANVISRKTIVDSNNNDITITINKGEESGIKEGYPVIDNGVIVGKINKVEANISHITLITSSNCKLAATIQNADKTIGIIEGELGLTINMNFIPQVEEIDKGDLIITSGLEKNIPRGILIGEITSINNSSNEIWQQAIVEPLVDFNSLIVVAVLLPNKEAGGNKE